MNIYEEKQTTPKRGEKEKLSYKLFWSLSNFLSLSAFLGHINVSRTNSGVRAIIHPSAEYFLLGRLLLSLNTNLPFLFPLFLLLFLFFFFYRFWRD